jgi:hypothetical protein
MSTNALFFAWNRPIPGRERPSAEHFQEFSSYLAGLQKKGSIGSFDTVLLDTHGGDLNGFFLIRGESAKLDALQRDDAWTEHMIRASLHLEGAGAVRGMTGDAIAKGMEIWQKHIPA